MRESHCYFLREICVSSEFQAYANFNQICTKNCGNQGLQFIKKGQEYLIQKMVLRNHLNKDVIYGWLLCAGLSANVDFVVCTSQLFFSFSFIPSSLQNQICRKEYNFWEGINSNLFFFLLPSREISSSILPRNKCSNSHIGMHKVVKNKDI